MSIKTIQVCQSCGLPMSGEYMFGTHGDGHPCSEYCRNCFQKGFFTAASLDEQQKAIAVSGLKGHADLSNLKRWMPAVQQSAWILDRCGYVILSTIDGNGFPRPVAIDVLRHDGIATLWMTTSLSSEKVKHLRKEPKAGICYVHEADSVTLTGTAEIISDMENPSCFLERLYEALFSGRSGRSRLLYSLLSCRRSHFLDRPKIQAHRIINDRYERRNNSIFEGKHHWQELVYRGCCL